MLFRDIVGTHCKDGLAVDLVGKTAAIFIRLCIDCESTQTDAAGIGVQTDLTMEQLYTYRIERLAAQTIGPPELWIFDTDISRGARIGSTGSFRFCDRYFIGVAVSQLCQSTAGGSIFGADCITGRDRAVGTRGRNAGDFLTRSTGGSLVQNTRSLMELRCDMQSHIAVCMCLGDQDRIKPCLVNTDQLDIPEDTGIRKMCAPVPAVHVVGLANMRKAFPGILRTAGSTFLEGLCSLCKCRVEEQPAGIFSLVQDILHGEFPGTVHVVQGS